MRKALDLTSAIGELEASNDKTLVTAIRKFHTVSSVSVDLNEVKASLEDLDRMEREHSFGSPHVAGAILAHAIVTYSRASHSDPISRWRADVTGAYNEAELKMHKAIVAIRDKSIAHFGYGEDWNDERVIYKMDGDRVGVTTVHRRSSFRRETRGNLATLLKKALPHTDNLIKLRADELLNTLICSPVESLEIIRRHGFDPAPYLDMEDPDEEFWLQRQGMTSTFSRS